MQTKRKIQNCEVWGKARVFFSAKRNLPWSIEGDMWWMQNEMRCGFNAMRGKYECDSSGSSRKSEFRYKKNIALWWQISLYLRINFQYDLPLVLGNKIHFYITKRKNFRLECPILPGISLTPRSPPLYHLLCLDNFRINFICSLWLIFPLFIGL